jgi:hypothetical protein
MQLVNYVVCSKLLGIYVANYVMAVKNSAILALSTRPDTAHGKEQEHVNRLPPTASFCGFWPPDNAFAYALLEILDCGSPCGDLQSNRKF